MASMSMTYDYHRLDDGGRMRYACLDPIGQTPRATIVVAPGRREFIEKKYAETGNGFLRHGYRMIIFEWRGQGLSDRFLSGDEHQRDHCVDFDSHLRDFTSFYNKIVLQKRTGPILFHGHSMGSHLLLRWMCENASTDIVGAIVTAPMLALASLPVHGLAQGISWLGVKFGNSTHYAASQHDYDQDDRRFFGNPLSQDEERFKIMEHYFTTQPEMTVGGVTWGWLLAALRSIHQIQRPSYLKRLTIPVLSITGGQDRVTPPHELLHYLKYLPKADNSVIPGAFHDILNEQAIYRDDAWRQIDRFLNKITPA